MVMKIYLKLFLFFRLFILNSFVFAQYDIVFKNPLRLVAVEKIDKDINKGGSFLLIGLSNDYSNGILKQFLNIKLDNSSIHKVECNKLQLFDLNSNNDINTIWDKLQLENGSFENILVNGLQYELREELNAESYQLISTLNKNNYFFNDQYLEDYLYSMVSKINSGHINNTNKSNNIFIKILKDPIPNAFTLPNGCIIITTSLLSAIESEDELVGILAHELAHFYLDHHIININKENADEANKNKNAKFWSTFTSSIAALGDIYLSVNNKNYIPGILTTSTIITSKIITEDLSKNFGKNYSQLQEKQSDEAAKEILKILNYNKMGLSSALQRIESYNNLIGKFSNYSYQNSHPSLEERLKYLQASEDFKSNSLKQSSFIRKVSLANSYNAWVELWVFSHHDIADSLSKKNIENNVATESDYLVSAILKKRKLNNKESNEEILTLLHQAKNLNNIQYLLIYKEEGLTYLRLNKIIEARNSLEIYLKLLLENNTEKENHEIKDEIMWTKNMLQKIKLL